jgi:hypothetical protein
MKLKILASISLLILSCNKSSTEQIQIVIPYAPTSLVVSNINANSAKLNWSDSSTNEDGFKIERKSIYKYNYIQK